MSKNNWKLFTYVGVGSLIIGGAIGGAVVFFLKNDTTKTVARNNVGALKKYPCEYRDENDKVVKSIPGLEFKQYQTRKRDGTYEYYFSDEEMKKFIKRFLDDGFYGPEIYNLKTIWISNVEIMESNASGTYYAGTNEITLDPSDYLDLVNSDERISETDKTDIKIETILEVLYHEYGHHFAYSYMNNPYPSKDGLNDENSIYSDAYQGDKVVRIPSHWNKNFINTFKHELCYDKRKDDYPLFTPGGHASLNSIGTRYNAQQLFDAANGQDSTMSSINTSNLIQSAGEYAGYKQVLRGGMEPIDKANLPYLYSMSELFTRKLLVMTYRTRESFRKTLTHGIVPSLMQEESYYETLYKSNKRKNPLPGGMGYTQTVATHSVPALMRLRYLQDAPFNMDNDKGQFMHMIDHTDTASNIFGAIMANTGQRDGADIAYMWSQNPFTIAKGNELHAEGSDSTVVAANHFIRFGGYISAEQKSKFTHVGFFTTENGVRKFHPYEILKHDVHFGYKQAAHSEQWVQASGEQSFYVVKDWIKREEIANHVLYFAEDNIGTHAQQMTTTRNSNETDFVSTYGRYLPNIIRKEKVYQAINDSTGVKIVESDISSNQERG